MGLRWRRQALRFLTARGALARMVQGTQPSVVRQMPPAAPLNLILERWPDTCQIVAGEQRLADGPSAFPVSSRARELRARLLTLKSAIRLVSATCTSDASMLGGSSSTTLTGTVNTTTRRRHRLLAQPVYLNSIIRPSGHFTQNLSGAQHNLDSPPQTDSAAVRWASLGVAA
jgi:hypothetical protein